MTSIILLMCRKICLFSLHAPQSRETNSLREEQGRRREYTARSYINIPCSHHPRYRTQVEYSSSQFRVKLSTSYQAFMICIYNHLITSIFLCSQYSL